MAWMRPAALVLSDADQKASNARSIAAVSCLAGAAAGDIARPPAKTAKPIARTQALYEPSSHDRAFGDVELRESAV